MEKTPIDNLNSEQSASRSAHLVYLSFRHSQGSISLQNSILGCLVRNNHLPSNVTINAYEYVKKFIMPVVHDPQYGSNDSLPIQLLDYWQDARKQMWRASSDTVSLAAGLLDRDIYYLRGEGRGGRIVTKKNTAD